MNRKSQKPTPEAKALSLFLMAYKKTDPKFKEMSKWINKSWDLVQSRELSRQDYKDQVQELLDEYGGYDQVVEKTVKYYIDKTGKWTLKGEDKYSVDAQRVADTILGEGWLFLNFNSLESSDFCSHFNCCLL